MQGETRCVLAELLCQMMCLQSKPFMYACNQQATWHLQCLIFLNIFSLLGFCGTVNANAANAAKNNRFPFIDVSKQYLDLCIGKILLCP